MPLRQIWYSYALSPCPTLVNVVQSGAEMTQPDFNVVFWGEGGRGKKEVFVMSSSLKSFILKLDILTSIFRNIFAQDCRIELAGLTFFLTQIWQHFLEFDLYLFVLSFEFLKCSVVLQDYHGWWRSFLTGGSAALYFFLYSIYFFCTKLTITGTASTFLYFGYTLIMVLIFFLFTGKNTNDIHHLLTLFKSESP